MYRSRFRKFIGCIFCSLISGSLYSNYVGFVAIVKGKSMEPTLNPNNSVCSDIVYVSKLLPVTVNDIVAFKHEDKCLIKRIKAKPGDVVIYDYGNLQIQIQPNNFWVIGDGSHSIDSEHFGPISSDQVLGVVTRIIWPPKHWKKLITHD
ncbi:hypothetical protein GJ496_009078 [Pomphorhynchus laevis]|nr:hypothetical protein GJ496_009078 [Pomphorhynchus laevis]